MNTNYGHPIHFGLALDSNATEVITERAVLAETLGYDVVTFDDGALDSWSTLAWIAGRTENIRLLPVVDLSLRSPGVLGRASASLDLLSGGRLQLALSAQDADVLAETADIIRGIWAVGEPKNLSTTGTRFRVSGAERGPAPAHDIPILVEGDGARMLQTVGAMADGWLVHDPSALDAANLAIDGAAVKAGRDRREVRRVLHIEAVEGPTKEWVEHLLPLVTERGVGTFLLSSSDPETIRHFITHVAPALRAAADQAIPGLSAARPVRSAAVLAKRVPTVDYEAVPASLTAIEPGDYRYARARSTYLRGGSPAIVLRPTSAEQVADAIAFARMHPHLPLGIRSAGHGISGRSTNDGGIVIDVGALDSIEVLDPGTRRVRVGAGATWSTVAAALEPYGWAITSGDYGGVGVGGLATAGGIGFLGRAHGLTIDSVRAVEVVLADGRRLRAGDGENDALFWAMRGAGANFGVATAFEFEAAEVPGVGWAQFVFDASDTSDFLVKWGEQLEASPRDTTSFLILGGTASGQPAIARFFGMVDSTNPDTIISRLQPFADIAPLYQQSVQLLSYSAALIPAQGEANQGKGEPVSRSGLLEHITPEFANAATRLLDSGAAHFFQIRATGGAASDVPADATAYAHRSANFSVVALGSSSERLDPEWSALAPHFDGLYLSFESGTGPDLIEAAFPPETLERLRALKREYDPANLFRDNFAVGTAASEPALNSERG